MFLFNKKIMKSNTIMALNYDECIEAAKIIADIDKTKEEHLYNAKMAKEELFETHFKPLLKTVLERYTKDKTISSESVTMLWSFLLTGLWTRKFFENVPEDILNKIENFENPFAEYINDSVNDMVNNGLFIYMTCHNIKTIQITYKLMKFRYNTIFTSEDPIEWIKNNNNEWTFKELENDEITQIKNLYNKFMASRNPKIDPFLQQ